MPATFTSAAPTCGCRRRPRRACHLRDARFLDGIGRLARVSASRRAGASWPRSRRRWRGSFPGPTPAGRWSSVAQRGRGSAIAARTRARLRRGRVALGDRRRQHRRADAGPDASPRARARDSRRVRRLARPSYRHGDSRRAVDRRRWRRAWRAARRVAVVAHADDPRQNPAHQRADARLARAGVRGATSLLAACAFSLVPALAGARRTISP